MYSRRLPLAEIIRHKSVLLFGPRQTGKTTLLRDALPGAIHYDLLESETYRELVARPEMIRRRLTGQEKVIVIDEIQRLPVLLNEVHTMIERNRDLRFVLTGSSARTLRRGGVNLLGGRAWTAHLFPLVSQELDFAGLNKRVSIGSLPSIYDSPTPHEDLSAYVGTYLREEIRAEGLVRSVESFSRFLDVAALGNGQLMNFTEVASDSGVPARTVREHFQLLDDTLLGTMLPPFQQTKKRKPVATSKFYLFDTGVANHLMKRFQIGQGTPEYGQALEHLIYLECRAWLSYQRVEVPLTFWRTHSQFEVDFLFGDSVAIEVKSAERVTERAFKGLRALAEEIPLKRKVVVSLESAPWRSDDGIEVLPVENFLRQLWAGEFAVN